MTSEPDVAYVWIWLPGALEPAVCGRLDGRYATYADVADEIRERFLEPRATLRELFARISFNILCSNTDDHGRNHAAFVREDGLALTPASDICPQARTGTEANQAMANGLRTQRRTELQVWSLHEMSHRYGLDRQEARELIEAQIAVVNDDWAEVCDIAAVPRTERDQLLGNQFLNPSSLAT